MLASGKSALASIGLLTALAWGYLIWVSQAGGATGAGAGMAGTAMDTAMAAIRTWKGADFAAMYAMWAVMMVAMMLPSITPVVVVYSRVSARRAERGAPARPTWPFVAGYLLVWLGFSGLATTANWALHTGGAMAEMMGSTSRPVAGLVLIAAGIFQFTPLKNACLTQCRTPLGFLADHWRENRFGAVAMGIHHGILCVGCCWLLMALLFVLGVMNIAWILALTILVRLEKVGRAGVAVSRMAGLAMIGWGAWMAFAP